MRSVCIAGPASSACVLQSACGVPGEGRCSGCRLTGWTESWRSDSGWSRSPNGLATCPLQSIAGSLCSQALQDN